MSEKLVSPQTEMDPLQDALMDVRQMRETIEALRGEMESISFLKEQAVQEAKALSYDEIKQLKDTSGALRESLDDLNAAINKLNCKKFYSNLVTKGYANVRRFIKYRNNYIKLKKYGVEFNVNINKE